MNLISIYKSVCSACHCHPAWHTEDGACHYDDITLKNALKFGRCEGCSGYVPTENLEYLEWCYANNQEYQVS